ncbi:MULTISPECIES: glycosyltransferase family 4 protein [unclassified Mucilaginibacter]|uniref:MraY family glycosyltransferase n=3 Tax=Mucilaginibacter TaxID=423349 RepID=UPI002B236A18|nr:MULTISPECIES: glycosyltransferase family 4 protein [unclassified Mucilaginibacter]
MIYLVLFLVLLVLMLLYFRIADHYNIVDHPNERSSHSEVTIRGGGVIFAIAIICGVVMHLGYWLPGLGLLMISIVSFIDDRINLSSRLRVMVHVAAVTLIFMFLQLFTLHFYVFIVLYIIAIGIINMYNFMDGINGITGIYTLVLFAGLQYVNLNMQPFIEADLIWLPMLASVVFLFFNFRKRAKCFAGDVGSVAIAFWLVFLLFRLIQVSGNVTYILFLSVYGVDAVLTVVHRLILKQNIFQAHRLHFYQVLVNEQKMPHLVVAVSYALIQLLIIALIILYKDASVILVFIAVVAPLAILYIAIKPRLMITRIQAFK